MSNLLILLELIIAQVCGGLLAVGMAYGSLFDSKTKKETDAWVPVICPKANLDPKTKCDGLADGNFTLNINTLVNEIVCTFIFVSVILMVKGRNTAPTSDGIAGAVGVVATLMGMIKTGMRLGACYNPAVGVALVVNALLWKEDTNGYITHYAYAYLAGPAIGGAAAGIFHLMHANAFKKDEQESKYGRQAAGLQDERQKFIE